MFASVLCPLALVSAAFAAGPAVPEGAVTTPTFTLDTGARWTAGRAFVTTGKDGPVLVSALHLLGPQVGLRTQLSTAEVAARVGVSAWDAVTNRPVARSDLALQLTRADAGETALDIVGWALKLDSKGRAGGKVPPSPLPLASSCPAPGALVWVPGNAADRAQGHTSFTASVTACDGRTLAFDYEGPVVDTTGMDGAPVLDVRGLVVGMVTGGRNDGKQTRGVGMSAEALHAHLEGLVLPEPAPPPPPPCAWGTLDTGWEPLANPWGLDLPGLHARLLPEWGLSGAEDELIHRGLAPAVEISPLFNDLARLSWQDNAANFPRILELMRRWNVVYQEKGVPLRMHAGAQGQRLLWMTWKILGTATVHLGGKSVPADLVGRLDRLNVADPVPSLLDGDTGVVVPYEDVRDAELYRVWRRLDPAAKDPFAVSLIAELQAALGVDAVAVLARTAPLRGTVEGVQASVAKRGSCSNFAMATLPWWGLAPSLEAKLAPYAVASGSCAPITTTELGRLRTATAALAAEPTLEAALSGLLAHLARSAAVQGAGMRLACAGCGWEEAIPMGAVAALSDPTTRVAGAARLCASAERDRVLAATMAPWRACTGRPTWDAVSAAWPADWGEPTVTVEGLVAAPPVRWPRDDVAR